MTDRRTARTGNRARVGCSQLEGYGSNSHRAHLLELQRGFLRSCTADHRIKVIKSLNQLAVPLFSSEPASIKSLDVQSSDPQPGPLQWIAVGVKGRSDKRHSSRTRTRVGGRKKERSAFRAARCGSKT